MFCNFCEKFKKLKWPPFLVGQIFFKNWVTYSPVTLWVKHFVEIALSSKVFKRQAFLKKNSKIQNGRRFWQEKYSLKLGKTRLHIYTGCQTFCRNRSILHGFRHTSIFVFCGFGEKFKMAAIFGGTKNFLKLDQLLRRGTLWVKNCVEIPLVNFYFMKKMVSKSTHISLSIILCVPYEPIFPILCFAIFVKNSKIEYDPHF